MRALFWFTGLSGAGKSTLTNVFHHMLTDVHNVPTKIIDGDVIRKTLCSDLGFSDLDRFENVRRIAEVCNILSECGIMPLVSVISPVATHRQFAKDTFKGRFIEVYVNCPIETCIERDPKGLYKKALAGEIQNFTGISSPYEIPENPDIILNTTEKSIAECVTVLLKYWRSLC